jgi:RNA polymerase sigma-70 factor (ECF subfamily)
VLTDEFQEPSRISRIAKGDLEEFDALYRSHVRSVFRFISRRLSAGSEEAEDVTQETFLSAVKMAKSYDGTCSERTWLFGIAKVRIIDKIRSDGRGKRIPRSKLISLEQESTLESIQNRDGKASIDAIVSRVGAEQIVDLLLSNLKDTEYEALVLHHADGLSVKEMSHLLGRSEKGIECLLSRARKKARQAAAQLQRTPMEQENE